MDKKQSGADVQIEEKDSTLQLEDGRTLKIHLTKEIGTGRRKPRYTWLLILMDGDEEKDRFLSKKETCWVPNGISDFMGKNGFSKAQPPIEKRNPASVNNDHYNTLVAMGELGQVLP